MLIHHKGVYPNRYDAPFYGALIASVTCDHNCPGCFHTHFDQLPTIEEDSTEIIKEILADPFNDGIILGGREWTLQPEEMLALIREGLSSGLEVILYTYNTEDSLMSKVPELFEVLPDGQYLYKGLYIKYGEFDNTLRSDTYSSYTVPLASTNQYIVKLGY